MAEIGIIAEQLFNCAERIVRMEQEMGQSGLSKIHSFYMELELKKLRKQEKTFRKHLNKLIYRL